MQKITTLQDQPVGYCGRIVPNTSTELPERLLELGFVPGTTISVLRRGPLGDPVQLELRGYRICLRRESLAFIKVERIPN